MLYGEVALGEVKRMSKETEMYSRLGEAKKEQENTSPGEEDPRAAWDMTGLHRAGGDATRH